MAILIHSARARSVGDSLTPLSIRYLAGVIAVLAYTAEAAVAQASVVIRNVTVIPMTGAGPAARQSVVIRSGRIAEIGPTTRVSVPDGASVVDGTGKYLIPGLFEMHAHTSKTRASALGLYVAHGVTTIRDQGSEHAEVLRWRHEIRDGARVGPRMLIAGPYLESLSNIQRMRRDPPESRVEPFERARIPVGSPADARRVIDSLAALEIDHFKVRTVQDSATYLALARAAHAHGKRLVGHFVATSPALFLEAGQDGVEHGFPLSFDALPQDQRVAFWRELAKRDVGVVPTIVVVTESVFRPLEYFRALVADTTGATHPLRPYISAFTILDWREQVEEVSPQRRAVVERAWPIWLRHVREMRAAGVRIMAGSDVAVLNIFPGASLHEELRLFVDSVGMSPMEALASATRKPAEWLGMADSVGTIATGKVADVVLLDADPLVDIKNTRRISAVVLRGRLFRRDDLEALRAAVRAMPDIRVNDWLRDTIPRAKTSTPATPGLRSVEIRLTNDNDLERQARTQLERIVARWDLSKWYFTRSVQIESGVTPHSHPVLTLNTNGLTNDTIKAVSFVHEQLHWFLSRRHIATDSAIADLRQLYPNAPAEGADDRESTYLHLLVGVLEFDATQELFGQAWARERLGRVPFYTWVYREILARPEPIRQILRKHGLDSPDARS